MPHTLVDILCVYEFLGVLLAMLKREEDNEHIPNFSFYLFPRLNELSRAHLVYVLE
jgi:hypothetical protein